MRYLTFALAIVLATIVTSTQAQDMAAFQKKTFISSKGDTLPYRILYPENYTPGNKYPMVLFLHGAGERGNNNEAQLTHGGKLFLADSNRAKFPAIIVFPQCAQNSFWANAEVKRDVTPYAISFNYSKPPSGPLNAALELTREIIQSGAVDSKRVYIGGLSMGGMGTFEAVYREPNLFAAAVPICGGGNPEAYGKQIAKIPFRIFHGADDAVVNVQLSREMVAKLKALKATVLYTEYPGVNHNSWDNAFAEPDFLSWIFKQKK